MTPIEILRAEIDKASDSYYNRGVALMTDNDFSTKLEMLRRLDHTDPRLTKIGADPTLDKVQHTAPMGSLDNIDANKPDELDLYLRRNKEATGSSSLYHITPKIDGSSIALTYRDGTLVQCLTRGNGEVGQDITAKAHLFKNVPKTLPYPLNIIVRGEAVMHRDVFLDYIAKAELEGVRNPRNIGNGIIVRKDCCGAGLINFYSFNLVIGSKELFETAYGVMDTVTKMYECLSKLGFNPPDSTVVSADGIGQQIDTMPQRSYDFDIDGLVIRVDSFEQQKIINAGGDILRPRSDQAIKYNSKKAETTVLSVTVTVGSTGKITPTLAVEPVEIGGVMVSNVLIYNYDEPQRLKLGIGDKIQIVLAGDIIPKVLSVVDKANPATIITVPDNCPRCNHKIHKKDLLKGESVNHYCVNVDCPGIQFERIKGYIGSSKRGVGILGIGEHLIAHLLDSGRVKCIVDLYSLTVNEMKVMPLGNGVLGEKRAKTIYENIQNSKNEPTNKIIGSLGVDGLGTHRAEMMIELAEGKLDTVLDWANATQTDYLTSFSHPHLPGVILAAIQARLAELYPMLLKMVELGVGAIPVPDRFEVGEEIADKPWSGLSFCFTGTRQYVDVVEKLGGKVASGVSKKTNYLIQKDRSERTSKAKKAEQYGTTVLGISELEVLINQVDPKILETRLSEFNDVLSEFE